MSSRDRAASSEQGKTTRDLKNGGEKREEEFRFWTVRVTLAHSHLSIRAVVLFCFCAALADCSRAL